MPAAARQQLRDNIFTLLGQAGEGRKPFTLAQAQSIRTPTLFIGGGNTTGSLATVHRVLAQHFAGSQDRHDRRRQALDVRPRAADILRGRAGIPGKRGERHEAPIHQVASATVLAFALVSSPALSAPDEKLRAAAEAAQPALIDTLRDMVMIESGSADAEGLGKMADFTEARLKALGAKTERRKVARGPGADIVIGSFEGTGTRKLMLMAHMDTVYASAAFWARSRIASTVTASTVPASPTTRAASP